MYFKLEYVKKHISKNFPWIISFIRKVRMLKSIIIPNLTKPVGGQPIIMSESGIIINMVKDNYLSFNLRPKKASEVKSEPSGTYNAKENAIIIQGGIGNDLNFLLETIELYEKLFPGVLIIISTWKNEKNIITKELNKKNVHLLLNEIPDNPGIGNIDLQIKSTSEGLRHAKQNGVKYCIKTRTDCRIYKQNAISYLRSIIKIFPPVKTTDANSRIVASSIASCKYRVYGLTDILLFGETSDLVRYFDPESHEKWLAKKSIDIKSPLIDETPVISEIFLCARYLDSIGIDLEWTLEHWWKCLKENFCVIDADSIDFLWHKYDWQYEKRFIRSYGTMDVRCIEFSDWLELYSNKSIAWGSLGYKEKWEVVNGKLNQKHIF